MIFPCVALRLSFLSISRFSFIASLSCVVSDALLFVSFSTASFSLVTMSLSAPAANREVLKSPPYFLHSVCQVEAGIPVGDLGILHQVMILFRKHFLKYGHVLSATAFLQHSFNDYECNPVLLTACYSVCTICPGVNGGLLSCEDWIASSNRWK